jgi:hypothetical protein
MVKFKKMIIKYGNKYNALDPQTKNALFWISSGVFGGITYRLMHWHGWL